MNPINLITELKDDVDLLLKSDMWLEAKKTSVAQSLSLLLEDFKVINKAIHAKRRLQQTNHVPVRMIELFRNRPVDEIIQVLPLPDAISALRREAKLDPERSYSQLRIWMLDGYDIEAAGMLRAS
jgi:hypothetical protein